jgi:hypothetical protein
MDIPVKKLRKLQKNVHIEIRDKDMIGSEPLGHANVTLGMFASAGPREEWVELKYNGMRAGRLHMRSSFITSQGPVAVGGVAVGVSVQQ